MLSNPNIEHEMKNEEWIRSIYTSSNTHTHAERRRHIIANEICIIKHWIGQMFMVGFYFRKSYWIAHVRLISLKDTMQDASVRVCILIWNTQPTLSLCRERLIILFVNVWARTSPFTKIDQKGAKIHKNNGMWCGRKRTETQTEQKTAFSVDKFGSIEHISVCIVVCILSRVRTHSATIKYNLMVGIFVFSFLLLHQNEGGKKGMFEKRWSNNKQQQRIKKEGRENNNSAH